MAEIRDAEGLRYGSSDYFEHSVFPSIVMEQYTLTAYSSFQPSVTYTLGFEVQGLAMLTFSLSLPNQKIPIGSIVVPFGGLIFRIL